MLGARVGKGTTRGGGAPAAAAMARRSKDGGSGWCGGGGEVDGLLYARARGDDGVISPCYGASAGVCMAG
jgi:hypothetical protein